MGVTEAERLALRVPSVIFSLEGHSPGAVAAALGERGIYVWSGDYYAQELMQRLGYGEEGMVRVGLAHYNTDAEVARLGEALREIQAGG